MASIQTHRVVERVESFGGSFITRVVDPSEGLEEDGRSEILLRIPPVRWARRAAACAQNAFVKTVELLAVSWALAVLSSLVMVNIVAMNHRLWTYIGRWRVSLKIGFDASVLLVEESHVGDQVLDDVCVW